LGTTYSLIYAEKNLEAVFAAIRLNKIKVASRPLKPLEMGSIARRFLRMKLRGKRIKSRRWTSRRSRAEKAPVIRLQEHIHKYLNFPSPAPSPKQLACRQAGRSVERGYLESTDEV
jgi:hypothetical protein